MCAPRPITHNQTARSNDGTRRSRATPSDLANPTRLIRHALSSLASSSITTPSVSIVPSATSPRPTISPGALQRSGRLVMPSSKPHERLVAFVARERPRDLASPASERYDRLDLDGG